MADWLKYLKSPATAATVGAAAVAGALYWVTRPIAIDPLINLQCQSQIIKTEEVYEGVYARGSRLCPPDGRLVESAFEDALTFYEAFQRGAKISGNGRCLGWRSGTDGPYTWMLYKDVLDRAASLGAGLIHLNSLPKNATKIGIYSQNRPEYVLTQLACSTYSMTYVALYDTLGPDVCTYIINQADIAVVICDKNERFAKLLSQAKLTAGLRAIVCIETPSEVNQTLANRYGVRLITFAELEEMGSSQPIEPKPCSPSDLFTICYTSGTTGQPKGVMTTHRNLIAAVSGVYYQLKECNIGPDDIAISYLPLAHSYEAMTEVCLYVSGGAVGFYRGNIKFLLDDIKLLGPTILPTVPRVLNRIFDKVMASVNSSRMKRLIFNMGMSSKLSEIKKGVVRRNSIWDSLVFNKIQESLGGRCRVISTGSAPISPAVLNFIRVSTGAVVIEGYGQTECTAVCCLQVAGEGGVGHVGCPLPCNLIKLIDVPEMDYYADENKGEVCVKGPNVFKGYFRQPERTSEVLDDSDWLRTGDIGCWLENGTLKIIDRKKNIFKLAQGEYIAPEKVENVYIRSEPVGQVFVHGDSLKSSLIGVVVPDPDVIQGWTKLKTGMEGSVSELCQSPQVKVLILEDMIAIGKNAGLQSFEQVKDIYLHDELFTVENGLLTPTFKSKRHEIQREFKSEISAMYEHLP